MAKRIEAERYVEQINTDTDFIPTETSPCNRGVKRSNPCSGHILILSQLLIQVGMLLITHKNAYTKY